MWPFIRGELSTALRKNDDLMFVIQNQIGLALVLMMFLSILTFLTGRLLHLWDQAQYLLALEAVGTLWMGIGYSQISRWRVQWAEDHVNPGSEAEEDMPLTRSLRKIASWSPKKKAAAESKIDAALPAASVA